eukprot:scaffold7186_cov83-Cylindrotheca_fusiformis.AAC.1
MNGRLMIGCEDPISYVIGWINTNKNHSIYLNKDVAGAQMASIVQLVVSILSVLWVKDRMTLTSIICRNNTELLTEFGRIKHGCVHC